MFYIDDFENYVDKDRSLSWVMYDREESYMFSTLNKKVATWSSQDAIKQFITKDCDLDKYLLYITNGDESDNLFYCFYEDELCGVALVTSPDKNCDDTVIQYLVVDPAKQGRGLGTAMLSSIFSNGKFFTGNKHKGSFLGSVHEKNVKSLKACLKSGFVVRPCKTPNYVQVWYCEGKGDINEK